jgi:hypothetical protein
MTGRPAFSWGPKDVQPEVREASGQHRSDGFSRAAIEQLDHRTQRQLDTIFLQVGCNDFHYSSVIVDGKHFSFISAPHRHGRLSFYNASNAGSSAELIVLEELWPFCQFVAGSPNHLRRIFIDRAPRLHVGLSMLKVEAAEVQESNEENVQVTGCAGAALRERWSSGYRHGWQQGRDPMATKRATIGGRDIGSGDGRSGEATEEGPGGVGGRHNSCASEEKALTNGLPSGVVMPGKRQSTRLSMKEAARSG